MTAAAPSPSEGRRPLGEVLVERGIVTPEQLAIALERQRATGQQLGEIIVALRFAPGPIVAQALATQHGGLIKTEYGFATGWTTENAATPAVSAAESELAERDRVIAELRAWAESAQAAIAARDDAIARLRAELAEQHATPDRTIEGEAHEAALEALHRELADAVASKDESLAALRADAAQARAAQAAAEQALTSAHGMTAELEESLAALRTEVAQAREAQAAAEHELASASRTSAELEESLAALRAEVAQAREAQAAAEHELAATRRTHAELERRLGNARSRAETLARRIAEQDDELEALRAPAPSPAEQGRWESAPMHYVLVRGAGTYDLVAHDGPPPGVGDIIDGLRVARVAPTSPGFDVPCAYLAD